MTSKYKASIKVRLTRVFNIAVLISSIILIACVALIEYWMQAQLTEAALRELKQ